MEEIAVTRTAHGPFERIVLAAPGGKRGAVLSVYRAGDTLFDAGGSRVAPVLARLLAGAPPRRIVLTHWHEDHAGGVAALRRSFGAIPVHAPEEHVALLRSFDRVPQYRGVHWGQPEPVPDAIPYRSGDAFPAGPVEVEALATPGHTPGHMALLLRGAGRRLALTGDLYVTDRPLTAWWESAADDLVRSWRGMAAGSAFTMLPTHGEVREDGQRAFAEVADLVERAAELVVEAARRLGTRDPAAVAREVFGPEGDFAHRSGGEFSYAAFARSVLDPVRCLPPAPVRLGPPPDADAP
ncbi:MAG: MBL fold metallo-hydrolase [Deltaproteobacteria bacterium]|nr:MBL fold metallo-hydrolase [Deltaproteobacteria bacterium]